MPLCPSCTLSVPLSALESHLRRELRYRAWSCGRCGTLFPGRAEAELHYASPFSPHPGEEPELVEARDKAKEDELTRLYRLATGETGRWLGARGKQEPGEGCQRDMNSEMDSDASQAEDAPPVPELAWQLAAESLASQTEPSECDVAGSPPPESFGASYLAMLAEPPPVQVPSDEEEEPEPTVLAAIAEIPKDEEESPAYSDLAAVKVPCRLCDARVMREGFNSHALDAHMTVLPFRCLRCTYSTKKKSNLRTHMRRKHECSLTDANFANDMAQFKESVKAKLVECFGRPSPQPTFRCQACAFSMSRSMVNRHVSLTHVKVTVFACRLCVWTSADWNVAPAWRHLKTVHSKGPDAALIRNEKKRLASALEAKRIMLFK